MVLPDEGMAPLYNCPVMFTWATTLNWYTPLGLIEVVDVSRGGGRWEGLIGVPTRLPL